MKRIDIDDPDVDMDHGQRLLYRGELFTGEAEERLGGVVVSVDAYLDGLLFSDDGFRMLEERRWDDEGRLTKDWRKDR
ncbi:hypothetical protein ABT381_29365 [Streptomyces sp. NPDC000151]|uniref:hypothetical protein n=1 Tax=Streptomyces sp. NPDC000151 TaxID=3154244 RepID=UPI00331DD883